MWLQGECMKKDLKSFVFLMIALGGSYLIAESIGISYKERQAYIIQKKYIDKWHYCRERDSIMHLEECMKHFNKRWDKFAKLSGADK